MERKRTVLPLLSTAFKPGEAAQVIEQIEDRELAEIAQAELLYFSAHIKESVKITEKYLQSEDILLRLSASVLYIFANLTLGNAKVAQATRQTLSDLVKREFDNNSAENEVLAQSLFSLYIIRILFNLSPKYDFPSLDDYLRYLTEGQQLFAMHMLAHTSYLKQEYSKSQGILQAARLMTNGTYPIASVYMKCLEAACKINQKKREDAYNTLLHALDIAKKDHFLEPFIEYHGLLQGVLEVCIKRYDTAVYKRLMDGVISFNSGWLQIHNPEAQRKVTDLLTPVEFSIAMLASRDWTNREIAEHMVLSLNTVKHYVSVILEKLQIEKRSQIKDFVNL